MQQRGEWPGLLGLFNFGFSKNWDFSKWQQFAEIRDFWRFLRYLSLFHLYIDDIKPQNHDFSQKSRIRPQEWPVCWRTEVLKFDVDKSISESILDISIDISIYQIDTSIRYIKLQFSSLQYKIDFHEIYWLPKCHGRLYLSIITL